MEINDKELLAIKFAKFLDSLEKLRFDSKEDVVETIESYIGVNNIDKMFGSNLYTCQYLLNRGKYYEKLKIANDKKLKKENDNEQRRQ